MLVGEDSHGVWLAGPAGTEMKRPGLALTAATHFVQCLPRERWSGSTFWDSGPPTIAAVYVDITTVAVWSEVGTASAEVTLVDLDLDVIRLFDGTLLIDDEDEFAEHQLAFGYPRAVIDAAEQECARVHQAMVTGEEPYGSVGRSWLDTYARLLEA
ncbi:MAG: DUF402 domain-containing protein [Propionibacteriaceae bacterium]